MRLFVIVTRVPDSRAVISIRHDGSGIEAAGVKFVCDPFDEFGVAQAVRFREIRSDISEIAVAAVGDKSQEEVLRHALAMGADKAVLVRMESAPAHDEIALAEIIATAARQLGTFDLILCGKQHIDNDAGEFGPALAEWLDLPHVGAATRLELSDDALTLLAHRRVEGADEVLRVPLPAVVTCEKGLIEPKHPPLPKVMKAKKEPIDIIEAAAMKTPTRTPAPRPTLKSLPARPPCQFIDGDPAEKARELVRRLREEAKVI